MTGDITGKTVEELSFVLAALIVLLFRSEFVAGLWLYVGHACKDLVNLLPVYSTGARGNAFAGAPRGDLCCQRDGYNLVHAGVLFCRQLSDFLDQDFR
jgi:hypothetical protein